ncbi:MAG: 6-bladed beta-propeller [Eubacteriales bacterium]
MEERVNPKWTFRKKNVYNLMAVIFLAISTAFGYMFYTDTDVTSIPNKVNPVGPPTFSRMLYGGFGEEALVKGMDVSVIGDNIYVTDAKSKRVQVFNPDGTLRLRFGKEGNNPGEFNFPYGIAGDSKNNVYVVDLYNGCISVHDSAGKFLRYFAEKDPKEMVIDSPGGLRIVDDKLYVTEIKRGKIYVFDLTGKKLLEVGKPGIMPGELRSPNAVTADAEGNIYVTDTGNQRIQIYDKTGKFIRSINGSKDGKGTSSLVNPRGIALDSRGNILVVSNLTHFVFAFDKEGNEIYTFGGNGGATYQFSLPNGLCIDKNGSIYVTDTANQRVAIYD